MNARYILPSLKQNSICIKRLIRERESEFLLKNLECKNFFLQLFFEIEKKRIIFYKLLIDININFKKKMPKDEKGKKTVKKEQEKVI